MRLDQVVTKYVNYRRSLGTKFEATEEKLKAFCKSVGPSTNIRSVSEDMVNKFLYGSPPAVKPRWHNNHSALLGFYQYALSRNYVAVSPLPRILPKRQRDFIPYIYSKKELKLLFDAALTYLKIERHTIQPYMIRVMLILTYALGLRLHETLSLTLKDVDMDNSLIIIRDSKFYKSRLVPFNSQVKEIIAKYLHWRVEQKQSQSELSPLFIGRNDQPCGISIIDYIFRQILERTGIKRNDGSKHLHHRPRIHDLRHSFAVHRLTSWYQEKRDVQQLLPILSVYMGHAHLASTTVYLTMTDELLREAGKRFEKYAMSGRQ